MNDLASLDCCENNHLERLGTNCNEYFSWGVFKCACGQTWYCLHGFYDAWQKDLKLVGEA